MNGHFCLVSRVSVHDRYYCIANSISIDYKPDIALIINKKNINNYMTDAPFAGFASLPSQYGRFVNKANCALSVPIVGCVHYSPSQPRAGN